MSRLPSVRPVGAQLDGSPAPETYTALVASTFLPNARLTAGSFPKASSSIICTLLWLSLYTPAPVSKTFTRRYRPLLPARSLVMTLLAPGSFVVG